MHLSSRFHKILISSSCKILQINKDKYAVVALTYNDDYLQKWKKKTFIHKYVVIFHLFKLGMLTDDVGTVSASELIAVALHWNQLQATKIKIFVLVLCRWLKSSKVHSLHLSVMIYLCTVFMQQMMIVAVMGCPGLKR